MAPQQPRTLQGKVAIVTGASRGIGEAIAFDLAARGAKVVLTYSADRSRAPIETLSKRITSEANSSSIAVQADLKQIPSAKKIVDEAVKAFGHVDILVNNAAELQIQVVQDITPEDFDSIFYANVRAPLLLVQAVLPHLRRPGRIINISSIASRYGFASSGSYCATKAALEGYTRNWAEELGADGTTVNAVNPGPVNTEMAQQAGEEFFAPQMKATPVQNRMGTVDDIAGIVSFLAEDRSSWISGQCISASGGYQKY